jgi:glycosyltransferase involved in cell wall biosynthesis
MSNTNANTNANKGENNRFKNISKTNFRDIMLPFVSICTPTFNRRPFIPFLIKCFEHQTYPKERMEWIIIDDGTDPIVDLVTDIKQVKYTYYKEKMVLGKKRNLMHNKCSGDIIIYMDDDDYYPPERVAHAVQMLQDNPTFLIAGCSEMHVYFDSRKQVFCCGPYKENHSTAASFAFRRELLLQTSYNNDNALAEERHFLKNYTIPMIQLECLKTILVFSHKHNSLNKEKLLDDPKVTKITDSRYTVDDFVVDPVLKQFYMIDMNELLLKYEPGRPEHKPKLMEQMKQMEDERNKRLNDHNQMMESQQRLLNHKSNYLLQMNERETSMETLKTHYEKQLADKSYLINELLKKVRDLTVELAEYKQPK